MTNITYFYNAVRDDDSVSTTSTDNEVSQQQQPNNIVQEADKAYIGASSVYSAIGNACLTCARPPIELVDDTSLIGSPGSQSEGGNLEFSNLKSFTNDELKAATWNFGLDSVFREGSLGVVMGWLNQHNLTASKPGMGIAIAVKRLNPGVQSNTEWLASVNHLRRLYHPNLVRLIGYCLEAERQLLVYEFTHQGSLEKHLFRRGSYRKPLTWSLRVSVALDAAKGLSFLHKAGKEVIHGDFKPSNILLDSNYNAKLCDFGLAKDSQTSMIETTYGDTNLRLDSVNDYAAPEYLLEGRLSAKSDVYSFGVVLLEILLGRRIANKNLALRGQAHFTSDLLHKDKLPSLMDRCLEGQYSVRGAQRVAHLALQCINKSPTSRPTMDIVVTTLQTIQDKMSL